MANFAYTILYVQNVTTSIEFYEVAFGFKRKFITPDNTYGELETGGTTLSFASIKLAKGNLKDGFIESSNKNKPFAIELGITTDNVDKLYAHAIKSGAVAEMPAKHKPQGQIVAYVRDLDGFLIEICTPME
ncbi:MAG TPA: VOC family protein [Cyclobacteriaceae bacterium]|nr:VOC family protein [Cyclobacteriaceae bacterium]